MVREEERTAEVRIEVRAVFHFRGPRLGLWLGSRLGFGLGKGIGFRLGVRQGLRSGV